MDDLDHVAEAYNRGAQLFLRKPGSYAEFEMITKLLTFGAEPLRYREDPGIDDGHRDRRVQGYRSKAREAALAGSRRGSEDPIFEAGVEQSPFPAAADGAAIKVLESVRRPVFRRRRVAHR